MPLSKNISSYEDIRPHLDRAISSERGIKITCPTHGKAVHLRQRLYMLRNLERARMQDVMDPHDEYYGTTVWDNLTVNIEDNAVLLVPTSGMQVEEL